MNQFTSDLFTPLMAESLATPAPRSYRIAAFGRRYGRASQAMAPAAVTVPPTSRVVEAIGDECVLREYDLAA